jgi:hypothetical protein
MAHFAKPWHRKGRGWFVELGGKQIKLGDGRNEWDTRRIFDLRWLFAEVVRFGNRRVSSQLGLSDKTGDCLERLPVTNGRRAY